MFIADPETSRFYVPQSLARSQEATRLELYYNHVHHSGE